jgi:hypothetical protein
MYARRLAWLYATSKGTAFKTRTIGFNQMEYSSLISSRKGKPTKLLLGSRSHHNVFDDGIASSRIRWMDVASNLLIESYLNEDSFLLPEPMPKQECRVKTPRDSIKAEAD